MVLTLAWQATNPETVSLAISVGFASEILNGLTSLQKGGWGTCFAAGFVHQARAYSDRNKPASGHQKRSQGRLSFHDLAASVNRKVLDGLQGKIQVIARVAELTLTDQDIFVHQIGQVARCRRR